MEEIQKIFNNPTEEKKDSLSPDSKSEKVVEREVYTMPARFYTADKGGGKKGGPLMIILILIVIVLLVGGGVFFLLQKEKEPAVNDNTNEVLVTNAENVNGNINGNLNQADINQNKNGNINQNKNLNTNSGVGNINLFPVINTNVNAGLNVNTAIPSSQDSDLDNLTDIEELLYGTDFQVADSDGDGYADGQEIVNNYSPKSSGKLENDTNLVRKYSNTELGYEMLYPKSWLASADPNDSQGVIFNTTTGEFIQISIQNNPDRLSVKDWYLIKSPGVDSFKIQTIYNWEKSLAGILSVDKFVAYYSRGDKVYLISYNTNIQSEANFKTTFEMMYKSFELISSTPGTNTNTNINTNTNGNMNTNSNSNTNTNINTNTNTNTAGNTNSL